VGVVGGGVGGGGCCVCNSLCEDEIGHVFVKDKKEQFKFAVTLLNQTDLF
jgi:hypothetical protein